MGDVGVSVVIPTRGDVDCDEIVCSFPAEWEVILWNNGDGQVSCWRSANELEEFPVSDLSVYARYAAIEYASHDIILTQDDDCIVSDPQAIVDAWVAETAKAGPIITRPDGTAFVNVSPKRFNHVVCNQPRDFRHSFYDDHSLVGFGAAFHRDAPARAFQRYWDSSDEWLVHPMVGFSDDSHPAVEVREMFKRTCDIVFTALTPRVLVDVPYENLPHAYADGRMYRQQNHVGERKRMLELVQQIK